MNFDKRDGHRRQRIAQSNAGVSECGGIDQDEIRAVPPGLLHPFDQVRLGITLKGCQTDPGGLGPRLQTTFDLSEGRRPVDAGFARTEQIQVRTVEQ